MDPQQQKANLVTDVEKTLDSIGNPKREADISISTVPGTFTPATNSLGSYLHLWNTRIESLSGFEARGIARVLPDERQPPSASAYLQMVLLWFSANITINNLVVGLYGPLLFELGFLDSSLCAVFGAALGAISTAYMSTWGAASGCRTLVRIILRVSEFVTDSCRGCNTLCYGILAVQDMCCTQCCPNGGLLHSYLYYRRTNSFSC